MQQKLQKPEYSYIVPSVTFTFYKTKCSTVHVYLLSTKMFHFVYINPAKLKSGFSEDLGGKQWWPCCEERQKVQTEVQALQLFDQ
jgi:hypothetical protein